MENWQKDIIRKNKEALLDATSVNTHFLSELQTRDVFSRSDIKVIFSGLSERDKVSKLYEILQTRTESYDKLLAALFRTNQTGAIQILQKSIRSDDIQTCSAVVSNEVIQTITSNLEIFTSKTIFSDKSIVSFEKLVLVSTIDVSLTKQKIATAFVKVHCIDAKEWALPLIRHIRQLLNSKSTQPTAFVFLLKSIPEEKRASPQQLQRCLRNLAKIRTPGTNSNIFIVTQLCVAAICECVEEISDDEDVNISKVKIVEDDFKWNQIREFYQRTILQREVYDQGKPVILKTFCESYQYSNQEQFYDTVCRGKLLVDLINYKKPPVIFRQTIPVSKTGYIHRKVRSRHQVLHQILESASYDNLLAFKDTDITEDFEIFLETSVERVRVENISSLKDDISSPTFRKVIVLTRNEEELEFLHAENNISVHLLKFSNNTFTWLKTWGNIEFIQKHLCATQIVFGDNELHNKIKALDNLILCDSAGMGKSVLLAKLALDAQMELNNRVFYYNMPDFIKAMKSKQDLLVVDDHTTIKNLMDVITASASEYHIKEMLFQQNLSTSKLITFLDGLDEVEEDLMEFAFQCLSVLRQRLPHLKLRITVRPHLLYKLEACLTTLGYNIEPFDRGDQLSFLTRYWADDRIVNGEPVEKNRLELYAEHCLSGIDKALSSKEKDIAGVPLQCLLIAEAFENEAEICANPEIVDVNFNSLRIHSLAELYDKMILKRFSVYKSRYLSSKSSICIESLELLHTYLAISIIYGGTSWFSKLKPLLLEKKLFWSLKPILPDGMLLKDFLNGDIPFHIVLKIGLLENRSENLNTVELQFLHRTFAEYLVAKFAAETISGSTSSCSNLEDLIAFTHEAVLETFQETRDKSSHDGQIDRKYKFKFPVICQFINIILQTAWIFKSNLQAFTLQCKNWQSIALASALENCIEILKLFKSRLHEFSIVEQHKLFSVIATNSLRYFIKRPKFSAALLRVAVERGDKKMMDVLISKSDVSKRLEKEAELVEVIKVCVTNSTHQIPTSIIKNKVNMLQILITDTIKPERLPIFEAHIHVDILSFLIDYIHSPDLVEMADGEDKTILHKPAEYLSVSDYENLVSRLELSHGLLVKKLSVCRDLFGQTPLHIVVRYMEPSGRLVGILGCVRENPVDNTGYNILWVGLRYQKSVECIGRLMEFSMQKVKHVDKFGRTTLHIAAQHYTNEKLDELLASNPQLLEHINLPDIYGNTPVFYALRNTSPLSAIRSLHLQGAKLNHQNNNKLTLLHLAVEMGNIKIIELLSKLTLADLFLCDIHGNTPMHFVFHSSAGNILEIFHNLQKYPQNLTTKNKANQCPLLYGLTRKHPDVCLEVLEEYMTKNSVWSEDLPLRAQLLVYLHTLKLHDENVNVERIARLFDNYFQSRTIIKQ